MVSRNIRWFTVLVIVLATASLASARPVSIDSACVFDQHEAMAVAPLYMDEDFGLGSYTRLRGAQVYVPAEWGLTAEWLTHKSQRELAASVDETLPSDDCRPRVSGVQVAAVSAGNGFWIQYLARDDRSAKSVLKWARAMVNNRIAQMPQ